MSLPPAKIPLQRPIADPDPVVCNTTSGYTGQVGKLHLMRVFVAVANAQSMAGAARELGLSPPAVTKAVNALEVELGIRLLTLTTRAIDLTPAAARSRSYFGHSSQPR